MAISSGDQNPLLAVTGLFVGLNPVEDPVDPPVLVPV